MSKQLESVVEKSGFIPKKDYDTLAENHRELQRKHAYLEQESAQLKRLIFGRKSERPPYQDHEIILPPRQP